MKDSGTSSFELEANESGKGLQLRLTGPIDSAATQALLDPTVNYVQLHYRHGWRGQSISLLSQFQHIQTLSIQTPEAIDLSAMISMRSLRSVYLDCPKPAGYVDFAATPALRFLRLRWGSGWQQGINAPQVEWLMLQDYSGEDLQGLVLDSLITLNVYNAKALNTLEGVQKSGRLQDLLLFRCRQLRKVEQASDLRLQRIEIESCNSVEDLAALFRIPTLRKLIIERSGAIASVAGAKYLKQLSELRIIDTDIRDPDLSALADLKDCAVFFTNKKHYSHRHVFDRSTGRFAVQSQSAK